MKALWIVAAVMLLGAGLSTGAFGADQNCYIQPDNSTRCGTCQSPAWDRTPVIVQPEERKGAGPSGAVAVDPWVTCGAFCAAGQIPPGWPYGWNAEYWLRPDSNY